MIEPWLDDTDNLVQLCITTSPGGRGLDIAKFVLHALENSIEFAYAGQKTSIGPLVFAWKLPSCVPPKVLPESVDFTRLPKDLRTRIESVLNLVSDLPIPIESADIFTSTTPTDRWDAALPPSFNQWHARLSFIGDSL